MVCFQCEICYETLKKKQVKNHYSFQCRNADLFRCLTCQKAFDRETIISHTSCITEDEKYKQSDNMKKVQVITNKPKVIVKVNLSELKWSGLRKTSKKLLMNEENYKLPLQSLIEKLAIVYARSKSEEAELVDLSLMKKCLFQKLENDNRFVIDLSKNTIRFKH